MIAPSVVRELLSTFEASSHCCDFGEQAKDNLYNGRYLIGHPFIQEVKKILKDILFHLLVGGITGSGIVGKRQVHSCSGTAKKEHILAKTYRFGAEFQGSFGPSPIDAIALRPKNDRNLGHFG